MLGELAGSSGGARRGVNRHGRRLVLITVKRARNTNGMTGMYVDGCGCVCTSNLVRWYGMVWHFTHLKPKLSNRWFKYSDF